MTPSIDMDALMAAFLYLCIGVGIVLLFVLPSVNPIQLGDEVQTTIEYNEIFNDSFSGHVVSINDGVCIVWDENGNTQSFEFKWLMIVEPKDVA